MDEEKKKWIDEASYEELLGHWRRAPIGDPFFQGELGGYYTKVMAEKRDSISNDEHVKTSPVQDKISRVTRKLTNCLRCDKPLSGRQEKFCHYICRWAYHNSERLGALSDLKELSRITRQLLDQIDLLYPDHELKRKER